MTTRAAGALLLLLGAACGGGTANGTGHDTTVAGEGVRFAPDGARAERYETASPAWTATAVDAAVLAALQPLATPPLEGDGALARLAAGLLGQVGADGAPPRGEVVEFLTRWYGLVEPQPAMFVAQAGSPEELAQSIAEMVREGVARVPYNRVAVASREIPGGVQALALVSMRWVEIEPVPTRLDGGASFTLRGRVTGPFRTPRVVVTDASDRTRELPAEGGSTFTAELPTDAPGALTVEVLGESDRGVMVLANFPLWIGQAPPTSVVVAPDGGAAGGVRAVGDDLFRLANQARHARGLPPLERTAELDRVALAHSADMHDHGFVGHTSPTTGSPSDRLEHAGVRSALVLENIGRGYSAREIHEGLMLSPGHRSNLLHAGATHMGVGVVEEPEGDRSAVLATEVFIQVLRALDPGAAARDLVRKVNQRRQARGAPPVSLDEGLSRMARATVGRFLGEGIPQADAVGALNRQLEPYGLAYRRVAVLFAATTAIDETAAMEPLLDPEVRVLGVGVGQGEHPEIGHTAIVTIVVMGWPR